jgi:hypothetical protein
MGMEFGKGRRKSHQRGKVLLAACLVFKSVQVIASSATAQPFMNATPYGCSSFISAKACSRAAYTGRRTGTVLAGTEDSDNVDSIFAVPA